MSYIEDNGYLIFDGVKSSDYGVWIHGSGAFNAPARRYKEYEVPGRNGVLTIDDGSFEEHEVTYPAFIVNNFGANLEAFRNALMARNGYVRMTDSYHPDEFYLARYMNGLEAEVTPWGRAGKFDLTFKRDPRRFLVSGETPASYPGENLLPYPYDGTVSGSGIQWSESGGCISASGATSSEAAYYYITATEISLPLTSGVQYKLSGGINGKATVSLTQKIGSATASYYSTGNQATFTHSSSAKYTCKIIIPINTDIGSITVFPMIWDASETTDEITNPTLFDSSPLIRVTGTGTVTIGDDVITVGSGYSYVDIDSEIQNCYCGTQNSNAVVSFASGEFPKLEPGTSGVSYSSGISSVRITPRWWRI